MAAVVARRAESRRIEGHIVCMFISILCLVCLFVSLACIFDQENGQKENIGAGTAAAGQRGGGQRETLFVCLVCLVGFLVCHKKMNEKKTLEQEWLLLSQEGQREGGVALFSQSLSRLQAE